MLACLALRHAEHPDHERAGKGKLAGTDSGIHSENSVFACRRVDVNAIAGDPAKKRGLRIHRRRVGRQSAIGANHFTWSSVFSSIPANARVAQVYDELTS